jgi:hypothetical protein
VLGAAAQVGRVPHPERSAIVGMGTVRNVAVALSACAMTALVPGLGQAALVVGGVTGLAAVWFAKLAAQEAIKASKSFKAIVAEATRQIDDAIPSPDAEAELARFRKGIARQLEFIIKNEASLRHLAQRDGEVSWLGSVLNWVRTHSDISPARASGEHGQSR